MQQLEPLNISKFIAENFEYIVIAFGYLLTAVISVLSVVLVHKQSGKQMKNQTAQKFVDMKFSAYQEFVDASVNYDENPNDATLSRLISTNNKAALVSPGEYAELFDHYCMVLVEIADFRRNKEKIPQELENEFKMVRKVVRYILSYEIQEFDPSSNKLANRFSRQKKLKILLGKQHKNPKQHQNKPDCSTNASNSET